MTVFQYIKALFSLCTPLLAKILAIFGLIYGISPLDIVPDIIPLLGQLDDVGIIAVLLVFIINMIRPEALKMEKASTVNKRDVIDI